MMTTGLAGSDFAEPWEKIRIPVVLMKKGDAEPLLKQMEAFGGKPVERPSHDEL
jgi:hypothetical protein